MGRTRRGFTPGYKDEAEKLTAMSGVWVLNPTDFDGPIPEVSSHASEKLTKGCNGASVNAPSPLSGSFGRRSLTSIRRPIAPQHLFQRTCS
jgi:hypothetical protein